MKGRQQLKQTSRKINSKMSSSAICMCERVYSMETSITPTYYKINIKNKKEQYLNVQIKLRMKLKRIQFYKLCVYITRYVFENFSFQKYDVATATVITIIRSTSCVPIRRRTMYMWIVWEDYNHQKNITSFKSVFQNAVRILKYSKRFKLNFGHGPRPSQANLD